MISSLSSAGALFYSEAFASPRPHPFSTQTESPSSPQQAARTVSVVSRSHSWRRLPLRGLGEGGTLPDQVLVGQPTPNDGAEHFEKPLGVGRFPSVESKRLFVEIPEQVKGLDGNVRALDLALQQRPEVFQAVGVGVDLPAYVGFRVVDDFVGVVRREPFVGSKGIGVDRGPACHVLPDFRRERGPADVGNLLHTESLGSTLSVMEETTVRSPKTLVEAIRYYADPDVCLTVMVEARWSKGVICPTCGDPNPRFISTRRTWECREKHPRRQFSAKVGTIFEDSPLPLEKWFPAVWLIANAKNGVSSHQLGRALGVTQKTAWFMNHRIRVAMRAGTFMKVSGKVEAVDEEVFRLNERGDDDGGRFGKVLRQVTGRRIDYKTLTGKPAMA
jgi:transposase-like protein